MGKECDLIDNISFFCLFDYGLGFCFFHYCYWHFNLEMILRTTMKESSSSRTLSSLFLILSLNNFFGSSKNGNDFISAYFFAGN